MTHTKDLSLTDPAHGYPGAVATTDYVAASVIAATSFKDLSDVNIPTYVDYTYPVADNATGKYIPGIKISDHTPTAGNILTGNGTAFESKDPATMSLVKTTDDQTIAGLKTFSTAPRCALAPAHAADLTNKDYVDSAVSGAPSLANPNVFMDTNEFQEAVSFTGNATITMALSGTQVRGIDLSACTFSSADIRLSNGATLWNNTLSNLQISEQTIQLDCSTGLDIDGGVLAADFGAGASYIKNTATGAAQDLTIWQAGAYDASLIIQSDGTGTDAIKLNATAGDIDIDTSASKAITLNAGIFTFTALKDDAGAFTVTTNTGTSEKIGFTNTQGTAADAFYVTTTAGGMLFISGAAFTIMTATMGVTTFADSATAITFTTNGGTAEKMIFTNTQGTGADAIKVVATAGGIDIDAALNIDILSTGTTTLTASKLSIISSSDAADAIYLHTNIGTSETINIYNQAGTGTDAIYLRAGAGGITLLAATEITIDATQNIDIDALTGIDMDAPAAQDINITAGEILLTGLDDAAANISIYTNAGINATLQMHNNSGTAATALDFQATAGGATFAINGASTFTTGLFNVTSSTDSATAITLTTNGGTAEKMIFTNTQGTTSEAIKLVATAGGMAFESADGFSFNEDIEVDGAVETDFVLEDRYHWKFDFDEKAADFSAAVLAPLYFAETLVDSGDISIVADEGGNVTLTTGANINSSAKLLYAGSSLFDGDLQWEFLCRFQIDNITNCLMEIGMEVDANDRIVLQVDSSHANPTNYYLNTVNNTVSNDEDTGVVCTTGTWHTVMIEVDGNDFELSIDGTDVSLTPSGTIRSSTVNMKPVFYITNTAAETKNLLIDFVEMIQERG